jgi:hypothetical protein
MTGKKQAQRPVGSRQHLRRLVLIDLLTSLREKLIKIGAKVVSHGRYVTFQLAEVRLDAGKAARFRATA